MPQNVIVLGASENQERYSYQAVKLLQGKGHRPLPVHPKLTELEGIPVYASIKDTKDIKVDTISIYVKPEISSGLVEQIIQAKPKRVIFNPGTENPQLIAKLTEAGIQSIQACTLVMLKTGQFELA